MSQDPKLIHRTVHFTLVDKKAKKILITQRAMSKKTDPGKICFLGEHVISGESYEEALVRGVQEELGIEPKNFREMSGDLFRFPEQTEFSKFFVVEWNGEKIDYKDDELMNIRWVSREELVCLPLDYSNTSKKWVETIDWGLGLTGE
ncbi:MAG: NUDIX hydrolase [Candidatus Shapirobacteria bacterium]|jgi:isopentenyldiphosphate isomerase